MNILVLNPGSSTLKYQIINMESETVFAKGRYEILQNKDNFIYNKKEIDLNGYKANNHKDTLAYLLKFLKDNFVIKSLDEINGVGIRVAHGGEYFKESAILGEKEIEEIDKLSAIAPLHNPASILVINAIKDLLPDVKIVGVFDTSFHQSISKEKFIYPIPYRYYEKYGIRKYGFHGTSHRFIANRVRELEGRDVKLVNCHLGQGASLCAIKDGKSVETTMGFTPVSGIMMCQRSGTIDPSIVTFLADKEKMNPDQLDKMLNKESGLYGISNGLSSDFREMKNFYVQGNEKAKLALEAYAYNIASNIVSLIVSLGGVDVITFTGGIGENQEIVRELVCKHLEFLGVHIDPFRNMEKADEKLISTDDSKVKVYVIPTDEELLIARDTKKLIEG